MSSIISEAPLFNVYKNTKCERAMLGFKDSLAVTEPGWLIPSVSSLYAESNYDKVMAYLLHTQASVINLLI